MDGKVTIFTLLVSIISFIIPGMYGVLGSAGFYVHEIIQDPDSFSTTTLLMYCFLGFVIATMLYNVPEVFTISHSPGVLIAAGFSVRKIADVSEKLLGLGIKLPNKKNGA